MNPAQKPPELKTFRVKITTYMAWQTTVRETDKKNARSLALAVIKNGPNGGYGRKHTITSIKEIK